MLKKLKKAILLMGAGAPTGGARGIYWWGHHKGRWGFGPTRYNLKVGTGGSSEMFSYMGGGPPPGVLLSKIYPNIGQ